TRLNGRPEITGTLVRRAESRSSTRPAGCGYRTDVHSRAAPARYVSRSRAGAAYASRMERRAVVIVYPDDAGIYCRQYTPGDRRSAPAAVRAGDRPGATRHDVFRPEAAHVRLGRH